MVLSLTDESRAGLWKMRASSSSMRVMLSPPKAAACALAGRRRKLYPVWLSCATAIVADSAKRTERRSFLIPIILFLDAKIMQTSAMKIYFQIAECRFFFCKDNANRRQYKRITPFFLFYCSDAVCLCKVCPIHGQYKKKEE